MTVKVACHICGKIRGCFDVGAAFASTTIAMPRLSEENVSKSEVDQTLLETILEGTAAETGEQFCSSRGFIGQSASCRRRVGDGILTGSEAASRFFILVARSLRAGL